MWLRCMAGVRRFVGIGPIQVNVIARRCQVHCPQMVLHGVSKSHGDLSLPDLQETYGLDPLVKTPVSNKVWLEFKEDTNNNENRIIQKLIILSIK